MELLFDPVQYTVARQYLDVDVELKLVRTTSESLRVTGTIRCSAPSSRSDVYRERTLSFEEILMFERGDK
jgi:hypothetical protein